MSEIRGISRRYRIDWVLLAITGILVVFGLLMMFSASSYNAQVQSGSSTWYIKRQIIPTLLGVLGMFLAAVVPYRFWNGRISLFIFGISAILTFLVLSPMGVTVKGATRWLDFKVFTLQPSEIVKVGVILLTAYLACKYSNKLDTIPGFAIACLPLIGGAGLVAVITDDLGTSIVIFALGLIMLFSVCPKKRYILGLAAMIGAAGVILIISKEYRMERIKAWLDVEKYSDTISYQIVQGLYAIGSGGLIGKGFGKSTQKMDFVPECENDMIFSIVCEELGIIGAIGLIFLFAFLLWRLYRLYRNTPEMFGKMVILGVIAHIGTQTALNMGVVTGLLPNTGVPLPFISYGGSSIIMILTEIGLVLSVIRGQKAIPAVGSIKYTLPEKAKRAKVT